ncbi:hypothetical protein LIT38_26425 [Bacillus sp. CMF12]|uniref:hypothetical protein n=1 Tax=Bacillus sp. CMF12 TaxID=2884834 RepID=UPI002079F897|nr:hypothetical protein [Bacillus sp. CMF12]USK49977.1 hypothetical protein LIT38_26425 [Bacillus sp. CMF12]
MSICDVDNENAVEILSTDLFLEKIQLKWTLDYQMEQCHFFVARSTGDRQNLQSQIVAFTMNK